MEQWHFYGYYVCECFTAQIQYRTAGTGESAALIQVEKKGESRGQRQQNTDECEIWKAAWEDAWTWGKTKKGSIISWATCRAWGNVGGPFLALHVWACGTGRGLPDSYSLGTDGIALYQPVQRTHTAQRPPPPAAIVTHHSHMGWWCKV